MKLNLTADEVLSTTRAVRKRLDLTRPVPRKLIEECLELAVQAPTGSNSQTWRWLVIDTYTDESRSIAAVASSPSPPTQPPYFTGNAQRRASTHCPAT